MSITKYGLDRIWNEKKFAPAIWNKIFRRSIIEEHGLRFESTRNVFSEDVLFNCFSWATPTEHPRLKAHTTITSNSVRGL